MPHRVTYIVANVDRAVAFEWIADLMDRERFELDFILLNPGPSALEAELAQRKISCQRIIYRGYGDLPAALWRVFLRLRQTRPDTVHAHLLPACLVGLTAAYVLRVKQRVYTRHHSTFHHDYSPRWVAVDRLIDRLSTHVVAISENVDYVLRELEEVAPEKIRLVHHGFRFADFDDVPPANVEALRAKYDLGSAAPVIGVIGRYIEWKGIEYIVEAARAVLRTYPDALFIFANARGDSTIGAAVQTLPARNYREIPFEPDLFALYRLFDVYVHVPVDERIEAFGQTYVEALIAGVPSVFTLSGVAAEFIQDGRNALVSPPRDSVRTAEAILRLLADDALARRISETGRKDVESRFQVDGMVERLSAIYAEQ
jgi:glycosyltransferase involved in cell wall biosynthesis